MTGRVRTALRLALAAGLAVLVAGTTGHAAPLCYPLDSGGITLNVLQPQVGQPFTVTVTPSVLNPCPDGTIITLTMNTTPPVTKTAPCQGGSAQATFDAPLDPGQYTLVATLPAGLNYCGEMITLGFTAQPEIAIEVVSPRPELPPGTVLGGDPVEISVRGCVPPEPVVFVFASQTVEGICEDCPGPATRWNRDVFPRETFVEGCCTVTVQAPPVPGDYRATVIFTESRPDTPFLTEAITVVDPSTPTTTTTPGQTTTTTTPGQTTTTTPAQPTTTVRPATSVPPPPTAPRPPVTSVPRVGTSVLPASTTFGLIALVTGGAMVIVARSRRRQRHVPAGTSASSMSPFSAPPPFPPPPPPSSSQPPSPPLTD